MDFETTKTIAAFGGLSLGLINLGISLYKDFFIKGKLSLEIEKAEIKWRSGGDYDFQINFNILASGQDVYLKDMWLEHPTEVFGPSKTSSKLHLNKVVKQVTKNMLTLDSNSYESEVKKLFKDSDYTRDLCIKKGQRKSFTLTDRFSSERLMDGWLEVPLTKWKLNIDYGSNTSWIKFNFHNICSDDSCGFHEWST